MRKVETFLTDSYQLEIWLEDLGDEVLVIFDERDAVKIQRVVESILSSPALANLRSSRRIMVKASYTRTSRVWAFQFEFVFGEHLITISEAIASSIIPEHAAATSLMLASSIGIQLRRLIPDNSEQSWEIRTFNGRNYLTVKQSDRRIRMDVVSFKVDIEQRVEIKALVHRGRVSERGPTINIDGMKLQATVASIFSPQQREAYWRIELVLRVDRVEYDSDFDSRFTRIWTRPFQRV